MEEHIEGKAWRWLEGHLQVLKTLHRLPRPGLLPPVPLAPTVDRTLVEGLLGEVKRAVS